MSARVVTTGALAVLQISYNNLQPLEPLLIPETSDTIHAFDLHSDTNVIPEEVDTEKPQTYLELVQLDDVKCVTNTEPFECPVCFVDIGVGEGIVLRDCLHSFCRFCLLNAIQYNTEVEVKCPFRNNDYSCDSRLQDREVKEVVPLDVYERYLQKSISTAESKIEKSFHCKTVDCCGWCEFDDKVNVFRCPVCGHENCINCQAIHETMNCKQYQDQLDFNAAQNEDAMKTKELIDNMLLRDEALRCPQCQVVLLKKWGCDWVPVGAKGSGGHIRWMSM
ncbi:unnamed protein product [Oppiella nova]|uniref:RanBP-type and C3HC4-type zinc finger-containing protein 1 n=1 Tax=Oppiella nova TaxID=334625 RepID=A0A7R9QH24_9ACAR|nr:unnamed protein product [Oppiella nova]CAG2165680.1 unnamed protein product [Oppiella nova]